MASPLSLAPWTCCKHMWPDAPTLEKILLPMEKVNAVQAWSFETSTAPCPVKKLAARKEMTHMLKMLLESIWNAALACKNVSWAICLFAQILAQSIRKHPACVFSTLTAPLRQSKVLPKRVRGRKTLTCLTKRMALAMRLFQLLPQLELIRHFAGIVIWVFALLVSAVAKTVSGISSSSSTSWGQGRRIISQSGFPLSTIGPGVALRD